MFDVNIMLSRNMSVIHRIYLTGFLILYFSVAIASEWKAYENRSLGFSISYPAKWNQLSQNQIDAQSSGKIGARPTFAVHNYTGQNYFVIATMADALVLRTYKKDIEEGLKDQYSEFAFPVKSPPQGIKLESVEMSTVLGAPALDVIFSINVQGVNLKQRQVCFIHNSKAFLLSGTSNAVSFPNSNAEYFSPMVSSFAIVVDK